VERISALADFTSFFRHVGNTAVTSIPSAPTRVVIVITRAVALEFGVGAWHIAFMTSLGRENSEVFVLAKAVLFAVRVLRVVSIDATAIASVPPTSAIVIFRVANAVLQPFLSSADAATLDAWVETLALRAAVVVVVILATAVSAIPSAHAVVVPVIADTIGLVRWLLALLSLANVIRAFFFVRAVNAHTQWVAFLAELFAGGVGQTTVAAVPIAAPVVVFRVTIAISHPVGLLASTSIFDGFASTFDN